MKKYTAIALTLLLCACARTVTQEGKKIDPDILKDVHKGMSMEDVESLLGTPSYTSTFNGNVWYYGARYVSQASFLNPKLIDQNIIAITFNHNGHVEDIAQKDKTASKNIDITLKETPAPGHHGGFFEDLFGHTKHYASDQDTKKK